VRSFRADQAHLQVWPLAIKRQGRRCCG